MSNAMQAVLACADAERTYGTFQDGAWRFAIVWRKADNLRCTTFFDLPALVDAADRLVEAEKALREIRDDGAPDWVRNSIDDYFASHDLPKGDLR